MKKELLKKKLLLLCLLQSTLLFNGCTNKKEVEPITITSETTTEATTEEEINYSFEEISEIIDNNPNIDNEAKDFLKKLRVVFDDNYMYMDLDLIKDRLSDLKITYSSEYVSTIGGLYSPSKNEIKCYNCTSFKDVRIDMFIHEFLHVLQNTQNVLTMELSNEFFSREITRQLYDLHIITDEQIYKTSEKIDENDGEPKKFGIGYDDYIPLYYLVAELTDTEALRKYQFSCEIDDLINGVCYDKNTVLSKNNMNLFVKTLNESRIYNEKTNTYDLANPLDERDIIAECANYLDYYFENKLGHKIKDDIKVAILFYNSQKKLFVVNTYNPYNKIENEKLSDLMLEEAYKQIGDKAMMFGKLRTVIPRSYLTNDYKYPTITFNAPTFVTITIDKEFEEKFNKKLENSSKSLKLTNDNNDNKSDY